MIVDMNVSNRSFSALSLLLLVTRGGDGSCSLGKNVTRHSRGSRFFSVPYPSRFFVSRVWSNRWPYKEDREDRVGK